MTSHHNPVAVTGATGALGGRVARILAERGVGQRLVVRTPDRAPRLQGAEVVQAAYGDQEATRAALDGVKTLFMVSAKESAGRREEHRAFIEAAAAAGWNTSSTRRSWGRPRMPFSPTHGIMTMPGI